MTQEIYELACRHGLAIQHDSLRVEEAGLDYRVIFAVGDDGTDWVLRVPRRPDVSEKIKDEAKILSFVAPRLSVAVPSWKVHTAELVAYRRLPGAPGLTLDAAGQPVWHFDPASAAFAGSLGKVIAELHALRGEAAEAAGVPYMSPNDVRATWRADIQRVQDAFKVAAPRCERLAAWLNTDALWPSETTMTHGELYAAHVLVDGPERITGILDWTTAKVGDPAVDFVYQHMMGPAAFDATVAAYLAAGGRELPSLGERCAAIAEAAPVVYGVFALNSKTPLHMAAAAAMLGADVG